MNRFQNSSSSKDKSGSVSCKTMNFMKNLMKECNLPHMQQRQFLELVENGNVNRSQKQGTTSASTLSLEQQGSIKTSVKRVSFNRPKPGIRLLSSIMNSDSFTIPQFIPETPKYNSGHEKSRLQYLMESNGKYDSPDVAQIKQSLFSKSSKKDNQELDEMTMLVEEIKERKQWLSEMSLLGKAAQYKPKIEFEVQDRVNRLEKLLVSSQKERDPNLSASSLLISK